eukprot:TRINITY_DN1472_c0_g1_i2.p1 TRINITY_DN1472_c0_g1~~TRINITY_DN1472_c0_g1_i2.p1  ORF type:complete len:224 (-),score=33.23 TRINITY_DN1472_c0_g1_i2:81-752(-)
MAMINYPYASTVLSSLPAWPANVSCECFANLTQISNFSSISDEIILSALFQAIKVSYDYSSKQSCYNIYGSVGTPDMMAWNILGCNMLPMPYNQVTMRDALFMESNGIDDMFPIRVLNTTAYADQCKQTFQQDVRYDWADDYFGGNNETITQYSKILFLNGQLDPWSEGSVLTNISSESEIYAMVMADSAHCLDLTLPNPKDPQGVIEGRNLERYLLNKWTYA